MQVQSSKLVTKIEANPLLNKSKNENTILRVAAYCRVSTDSEDQLESYKAQVAYYTDAIAKNPRWRFVAIYADEGITGTQAKKRDNFMRMIRDCDKGKIDLILTKSVARFARNTVDSLKYIRRLKAKGIGVYFEEQALDSLKADSEMFIGLHSVLAQAESENISANVRWGIQQRMKTGTFSFRYNLLGYRKGINGEPEINEEEAKYIRKIYSMYLDGNSLEQIVNVLNQSNFKTFKGKDWSKEGVKKILVNERYSGDMLLQKTYTENCITKKVKRNRGEMPKYLIVNSHPAIIDREIFKKVQREMARRASKRKTSDKTITQQGKYSGKYALTELLICGEWGSPYRRKIWRSGGKSKAVWRCLSRLEHGTLYCKKSVTIEETKLHQAICQGLSKCSESKEALELILSNIEYAVMQDDDSLELCAIKNQRKEISESIDKISMLLLTTNGNKDKYETELVKLMQQHKVLVEREEELQNNLTSVNKSGVEEVKRIKEIFQNITTGVVEYNDKLIRALVEYIKVLENKLVIILKCGIESVVDF